MDSMQFDPENEIVRLCAQGMEMEGQGRPAEAAGFFREAWEKAAGDFEKFTAAHYVARHQPDVQSKLSWDLQALKHALALNNDAVKGMLPSLYLNVGKCYEELGQKEDARLNYTAALSFIRFLSGDGYGEMIRKGIQSALERVNGE